jgi:putative transposase
LSSPSNTVRHFCRILSEEVVTELRRITLEIEERYEIEVECLGADRDHIHLLCSAHPKIAPGQIVRIYKSITARELFKTFPELRKELWGGAFWSEGYYAATASQRGDWKTLVRYIEQQGEKPQDEAVALQLLFPQEANETN